MPACSAARTLSTKNSWTMRGKPFSGGIGGPAGTVSGAAEVVSDAELLKRFALRHDESAFAALVTRHGPMVFRVCRRVLQEDHGAEDAFQAAFLVLARKAQDIRSADRLAAWLYGVAYRV